MAIVPPIECGPFRLIEPIGAGGMGEVYLARHENGERAAVKLLTGDLARDRGYRAAFRREIYALAQLNHPCVASILDFGFVDGQTSQEVPPGSPWFAMEYVDGLTVAGASETWQWAELREFTLALLDALAHAHARRVLHRDLKPSNVVLRGGDDPADIVLVDFGIAEFFRVDREQDERERTETTYGTPKYMAPEQILAQSRWQGPWTDLYAMGCLIWKITCGTAAHRGSASQEILNAHLAADLAPFRARFPVPDGLERWLRTLLRRSPRLRVRRAADARRAFLELDERPGRGPAESNGSTDGSLSSSSTVVDPTVADQTVVDVEGAPTEILSWAAPDGEPVDGDGFEPGTNPAFAAPSIPATWRHDKTQRPAYSAPTGMNLFGLRKLPFVDREVERDALWAALRKVYDRERPQAVLVHGPAGCGKSRLIEWLSERAHECGAATPIRVTHSRPSTPSDGLASALVRWFQCTGLEWSAALERLTEELEHHGVDTRAPLIDAAGLLELAGSVETPSDSSTVGFSSAAETNRALLRIISALAGRRPVVLWLDDALRDPRTISFVRYLCDPEQHVAAPVLVVMTSRDDELSEFPDVAAELEDVCSSSHRVAPLSRQDHAELIRCMLPFDEPLVKRIADRTEGHPLFAVQIVRDWVERGVVRQRDGQVSFVGDREQAIPADLHRLWRRRLERLVREAPHQSADVGLQSLELAAVLGKSVDGREWRAVCLEAGWSAPMHLVDLMVELGLAVPNQAGWAFAHGLLAESLRRLARESGRFRDHHRRCARVLETLYEERNEMAAERLAEHWVQAGEPLRAYQPLRRAAGVASSKGDYRRELGLLERQVEVLDAADTPATDWRRAENAVTRADALLNHGKPEQSERLSEQVRSWTRNHSGPKAQEIQATYLAHLAGLANISGEYETALGYIDQAEHLCRELDDDKRVAACLRKRGFYLWQFNEYEQARAVFERSRELLEAAGEHRSVLRLDWNIAWCWFEEGEYDRVREIAGELLRDARATGNRELEASAYNILGELARVDSDWEEAARCYQEAVVRWRQNGSRAAVIARLNQVFAAVGARQWDVVDRECEIVWERLGEQGYGARRPQVSLCRALAAVVRGDDEGWRCHMEACEEGFAHYEYRTQDAPWLAEQGVEICDELGYPSRVQRLSALAASLRRDLAGPSSDES